MPNAFVNVPLTGGVNLLKDARRIDDTQVVSSKNMVPVVPGVLKSRPGASIEFVISIAGDLAIPILSKANPFGLDWPNHIFIMRRVAATSSNTAAIAWWFNGVGAAGGDNADLGIVTQYIPQVLFTGERVYVFGGYGCNSQGKVLQASSPGVYTWLDFSFAGTGNGDIWPQVAAVFRERVLYGNLGPGLESTLILADTGAPTVVGNSVIGSRDFTVGDGDGDRIVAIKEIMQSAVGTFATATALVLKEFSTYIITGLPSETGTTFSLEDFTVNKINFPCGCSSRETLVQTPYGLIWAGPDDVWLFAQGQLPVRIGTNIRPALARTPANLRYRWHAEYFNGFYRLALFGEGQGPDDDSPCKEQYWLDLRDGAPASPNEARWWGPQQYSFIAPHVSGSFLQEGTYNLSPVNVAGQESRLYSVIVGYQSANAYTLYTASMDTGGPYEISNVYPRTLFPWVELSANVLNDLRTLNGNTYKCIEPGTTGATGPTGYYESIDGTVKWRYVGPSTFPAQNDVGINMNINTELVTKIYDYGDPILRKVFQAAELDIYTSSDCQVSWDVSLDDGRQVSASNSVALQGSGFQTNQSVLDTDHMSREFQSIRCSPDSGNRYLGKLHQFKIRNNPGYLVQADYNDSFVIRATAGPAGYAKVTIAPGFYSSFAALNVALQTAINAALATISGTYTVTVDRGAYGVLEVTSNTAVSIHTGGGYDVQVTGVVDGVTERTCAMLGLEGGMVVSSGAVSSVLNGIDVLHYGRTPTWELGSIVLKVRAVPRRPA